MIRIYDKEETIFSNLGLGSLDETISAVVIEELNGSYEMEMEYPITGRHFDKLQQKNIILCKPNMYDDPQPFRIYSITKPINGIITVKAEHISYDANGVVILPKREEETNTIISFGEKVKVDDVDGYYLDSVLEDINNSAAIQNKNRFIIKRASEEDGFKIPSIKENVFKEDGFKISSPTVLRSILGGKDGSILDLYKGEYEFDNYEIILHNKRGTDREITIRYGKNMLDLEQEIESNQMYTAVFPFYSKTYTETQTGSGFSFQKAYIRENISPLRYDWLSTKIYDSVTRFGGEALEPLFETVKVLIDGAEGLVNRYAPVRVDTPDTPDTLFYQKIYVFRPNSSEYENLVNALVVEKEIDPVTEKETITQLKDYGTGDTITPVFGTIYIIKSEDSQYYNRNIIWDNGEFVEYNSDGFYIEAKDAASVSDSTQLPTIIPLYPIRWDADNNAWIRDNQNGSIYTRAVYPMPETTTVEKYVYLDLLSFDLPENSPTLLENGVIYVNEELKDLNNQKVLNLDLTASLDSIGGIEPHQMTKEHLFDKAEQYLNENDLTKLKESVTISFIKLSDSEEYKHLRQLEVVKLGDEINVIHERLGVNSKNRVISTEYNVLTNSYNEIELGEKKSTITGSVVTVGDNVSKLNNDAEFTDKTYVTNFVAENARIVNAEMQNVIIQTLEAGSIDISNSLTASHATIDQLVAKMMTAENAKISELLESGSIRVSGKITALSGEIGGCKIEDGKLVVSSSINITNDETEETKIDTYIVGSEVFGSGWLSETEGGTPLTPVEGTYYKINTLGEWYEKTFYWTDGDTNAYNLYNETKFEVDSLGKVTATSITITGNSINEETKEINKLQITPEGHFECNNVEIKGNIIAESLNVKDFVQFNNLVKLTHTLSSQNVNQQVSFNASVQFIGTNNSQFMVSVWSSLNVWEDETIVVYVSYLRLGYSDPIATVAISCKIDEETNLKDYFYITTNIFTEITPQTGDSLAINTITPNSVFESKTIDINVLSPDSHFGPEEDNTYDLGSTEKRWKNAFVNKLTYITLDQSSDRRLKKEINYDISMFDKFFDTIKPVSYKYLRNNDSKIRFGFIAQDIAESLKLHNLNEDYALYSKKINEDSKHKEITDLSEDDYSYSLSYSELHAIEVRQIQLLKNYIYELEKRIKKLENEKDL